jgi:protein-S-isoprenylcysteine O-methyltransferase Ste14
MTALKSLFFLILVPGVFVILIPLAYLRIGPQVKTGLLAYLAIPLWLVGWTVIIWCFRDFLVKGRGTPAPFDPPRELVTTGPYRYVRNPMYVGVEFALLGNFLWFGYWWMLAYAAFLFAMSHHFILFYEAPGLRKRFGASYEAYLGEVPRWMPRFVPSGQGSGLAG